MAWCTFIKLCLLQSLDQPGHVITALGDVVPCAWRRRLRPRFDSPPAHISTGPLRSRAVEAKERLLFSKTYVANLGEEVRLLELGMNLQQDPNAHADKREHRHKLTSEHLSVHLSSSPSLPLNLCPHSPGQTPVIHIRPHSCFPEDAGQRDGEMRVRVKKRPVESLAVAAWRPGPKEDG